MKKPTGIERLTFGDTMMIKPYKGVQEVFIDDVLRIRARVQ